MRNRIIAVIIAIVVLVGLSLGLILLVRHNPKLQNTVYKITNTSAPTNAAANINLPANINAPPISSDRVAITAVARNFTERYGSWSNENKGSNLVAAQAYGTKLFNNFLATQIAKEQSSPAAAEYQGVITTALAFHFETMTAANATVLVTTRQQVTTGAKTQLITKDILLIMLKVGSDWKINSAVWH